MPRPISEEDLALALDNAPPRLRAWLLLMALAGLRALEISGLRPEDVIVSEHGALLFLRECKGGASATVPAHPAIVDALTQLPVRNGVWWSVLPRNVSSRVNKYLRSLGILATGHQLRHAAGTSWYRASGHDLLATAQLLRHARVSSTQIYAKIDAARPAQIVALVTVPEQRKP